MDKTPLIGLAGAITLAMMTELNDQISSQALVDISGAIGMSHDPATWYESLYTSAEIIGMALSPWCAVTFSLRRFALFVVALCCLSTLGLITTGYPIVLFGLRVLQGLSGGFAIPLLMTTALRVLPPPIRLYGLAAYALTATFFPNLSTALAGLWTDLVGWHFIFFQCVPLGAVAGALIAFGLPQDPPNYGRFRMLDWRGILLVVVGTGSLSTMLMQGTRLDWFNSPLICVLGLTSLVCMPLLVINEWFHELPLLKIQLLLRPNFGYGALALFTFLIIASSSSTIPGAVLTEIAGYRPEQVYPITLEIAAAQLLLLPLMAIVLDIAWVDSRVVSFIGMAFVLAACIGSSFVTVAWKRDQFFLWQGLQACGEAMIVMPLLLMATNTVKPPEGPFAAGLINTPRALAEAVSAWVFELVNHWRGALHSDRLADQVGRERFRTWQANSVSWQHPAPLLPDGMPRSAGSVAVFKQEISKQALALTLSDAFLVMAALTVVLMIILMTLPVRTYPPRIALAQFKPK